MTYETIRYESARSLARITLDRPDRMNATMRREPRRALRRAGEAGRARDLPEGAAAFPGEREPSFEGRRA